MALWTPADITTALWLDAADAGTLVGSPVTTWNDKSGNSRHATASSAVALDDTTFPHNALSFNGAQRFTVPHAEALSALGGLTVIGVVKYNATTTNKGWIGKWQTGALDWYHLLNAGGLTLGVQVGGGQTQASHAVDTNPHILGGLATPSDTLINTKDGVHVSVALGTPSGTASGALSIGGYSAAAGVDFAGLIGEVIICGSAVSLADFQKLEGYLAHKWGLAANLPSGHPHKLLAPGNHYTISGTTRDKTGALAARTVTALRESDQTVVATTTSDAVTGAYEIATPHDEAYTLIFSGESDRNALVYSGVLPS